MFRLTRRSLWEHKRRLVSTVVAIVLGVAFMAGTFVLSDTIDRAFDDLFSTANEEVDAQVQGPVLFSDPFGGDERALLDPSTVELVQGVDGVAGAAPFVTAVGFGSTNRVLDRDGEPIGASQGPPTLIESWVEDDALRPYNLRAGRGPEAADELALNTQAAEDGDFSVGDEVTLLSQSGPRTYTLVGIFDFGEAKSAAGAVSVDFTLAEAQRLAGIGDKVQQVLARADDGVSQQELVDRIAPVLPKDVEVITGTAAAAQLSSDVQSGFQFFQIALSVFGGLALLVGVFVISNTFSILVAQRTRELALLRAVGASRGQVLGSVLLEALLVGLLASGLGLLAGIGLATGVTSAFEASGADLPTRGLTLSGPTVLVALVAGLGVTLVSALVPAVRSMSVPPLAALRAVSLDRSGTSRARLAGGVVVVALGLLNLSTAWRGEATTDDLPPTGLGAVLVIIGAIVLGPVLAGPSVRVLGAPLSRLRGITGQLATENAARSPKRTSATSSAILIAVALIGFITCFAASAKASVTEEVNRGFVGDFVVQGEAGAFGPPSGFPTSVGDDVAEVPGVAGLARLGFARAQFRAGSDEWSQFLSAVDPAELPGVFEPRMAEGSIDDLTDDGIVVDVGEAQNHDIAIGDDVEITFPGGGTRTFEVQAISDDEVLLGYLTVTQATFRANNPEATDFMLMGRIEPGADLDTVLERIDKVIEDVPGVEALDRDGLIGTLADQINQFVTVIYVLLGLSVIVALIGIANTISLSVNERTRELGLLRAVGMNRSQLRASIRWEAVLMSVLGALVGLGLGVALSRAVIKALEASGLTAFRVPVGQLLTFTVAAALLAVLASYRAARRASKLAVLDAISSS